MKAYKVPTVLIKSGWTVVMGEDASEILANFEGSLEKGDLLDTYPDHEIPVRMSIGKISSTEDCAIPLDDLLCPINIEDIVEIVTH